MKDARVKTSDLVRIVSLYALRYEQSNSSEYRSFKEMLLKRGGLTEQEKMVPDSHYMLKNQFFRAYLTLYLSL